MSPPSVNTVPVLGFEAMHAQDRMSQLKGGYPPIISAFSLTNSWLLGDLIGFRAPGLNHGTVYAVTSLSLA